jgi:hypothetical protein
VNGKITGLELKRDLIAAQFMSKAALLERFQQSRSDVPVNRDRTTDGSVRRIQAADGGRWRWVVEQAAVREGR